MFEETNRYHDKNGRCPDKKEEDAIIVNAVYDRIEKAEIWIPYGEVLKHYRSIKVKLCRRIRSGADAGEVAVNSNSLTARGVWQRLTR